MNERRLKESLAYAKSSGIVDVDVWGIEWMYWRTKSDDSLNYWKILADAMTAVEKYG